jgi:hypothetical protein
MDNIYPSGDAYRQAASLQDAVRRHRRIYSLPKSVHKPETEVLLNTSVDESTINILT